MAFFVRLKALFGIFLLFTVHSVDSDEIKTIGDKSLFSTLLKKIESDNVKTLNGTDGLRGFRQLVGRRGLTGQELEQESQEASEEEVEEEEEDIKEDLLGDEEALKRAVEGILPNNSLETEEVIQS